MFFSRGSAFVSRGKRTTAASRCQQEERLSLWEISAFGAGCVKTRNPRAFRGLVTISGIEKTL